MACRPALARALLFAGLAATASLARAEDGIYRSRDAQGNVIFSDKSNGDAEAVTLPQTNTIPEVAAPARPGAPAPAADAAAGYALAIVTPGEGQTVFTATGTLEVGVSVTPELHPGHSLRVLVDGTPAGAPQQGALTVEGLGQGPHTLALQVLDADGDVVQTSGAVTVYLQRPGGPRRGPFRSP